MLVVSCVRLFLTLWTVACQTLFSRDYFQAKILEWIAISFSRDLPNPGIEHTSPVLAGGFFTTESPGKPVEKHGASLKN